MEGVLNIIGAPFVVITVNEPDDPVLGQAASLQRCCCSFPSPYAWSLLPVGEKEGKKCHIKERPCTIYFYN